jgi:hypothetical protein
VNFIGLYCISSNTFVSHTATKCVLIHICVLGLYLHRSEKVFSEPNINCRQFYGGTRNEPSSRISFRDVNYEEICTYSLQLCGRFACSFPCVGGVSEFFSLHGSVPHSVATFGRVSV